VDEIFGLPRIPAFQFSCKTGSDAVDEVSETVGTNTIPAKCNGCLLFEKVARGNRDRVYLPIFRDEPLDDIVRRVPRIRIENLNAARLAFLSNQRTSSIEHHNDIDPALILIFRQYLDKLFARNRGFAIVESAKFRPCEDDAVAVYDEELGTHADENYASIDD
jgi:hypothetical protein